MIMIKTRIRIAILMFLVGVAITITFLFHSKNTTQELNTANIQNAQRLHLEIPNAHWEPYFFKELEKYTSKVNLPSLRTVVLPDNDLEMRFWFDSLLGTRGLILRRSNEKWSALYLHEVYANHTSSIKVENLEPPVSGWDAVWKQLVREGILVLPDSYFNEECRVKAIDGEGYIVETNVNHEYRTFNYGNPQHAECDEARHVVSMVGIILGEFELGRFYPGLPDVLATQDSYWEKLDKTNLNDLKSYLAKSPKGLQEYPAEIAIRNIKAAKSVKTASNSKNNNLLGDNTQVVQSDLVLEKRMAGDFVPIPAGNFTMGSNIGYFDERPAHEVIISKSFEMGKYEVTQEQWELVMGNNPSFLQGDKRLPVENVSWNDVQRFINALNSKSTKYIYRLPTEAEWEYAARAGNKENYVENLDAMAWYVQNSGDKRLNKAENKFDSDKIENNFCRTHPVGQKKPNAWGLYDMYGNVWEWCSDWYGEYSSAPVTDPRGTPVKSKHVNRGGGYNCFDIMCQRAVRNEGYMPGSRILVGFRLVRTLK